MHVPSEEMRGKHRGGGLAVRAVCRQESPRHLVSSGSGWALAAAQAFSLSCSGKNSFLSHPSISSSLFSLESRSISFPPCQNGKRIRKTTSGQSGPLALISQGRHWAGHPPSRGAGMEGSAGPRSEVVQTCVCVCVYVGARELPRGSNCQEASSSQESSLSLPHTPHGCSSCPAPPIGASAGMNLDKPLFIAAGTSVGPLPGKWASWGSPPDWRTVDTSPRPRLTRDPQGTERQKKWGVAGGASPGWIPWRLSTIRSPFLPPRPQDVSLSLSFFWFRALNHLSRLQPSISVSCSGLPYSPPSRTPEPLFSSPWHGQTPCFKVSH